MKRKNTMRNALVTSVISMLLCVSMLVGTTFAWFTDEVVSGMNTIAAGNLDVELLASGNKVDNTTKLFDGVEKWEPGVVVYENLEIANVGTLALKYQMTLNFKDNNDLNGHKLSEVVKVALVNKIEASATRAQVLELAKAAVAADKGNGNLANFYTVGELLPGETTGEKAVVVFWEPTDHDNDYNANNGQKTSDGKPLSIEFGINLQATQKMYEEDSFGPDYDKEAAILPKATVNNQGAQTVKATVNAWGGNAATIDYDLPFVLQFLPNETLEQAQASQYRYWHADYVVTADRDVSGVTLGGYYKAFCGPDDGTGDTWNINDGRWVVIDPGDEVIAAGTEVRLVQMLGDGNITVNYEDICEFGNDGIGFLCGAADASGKNAGTTLTVELRMYEVPGKGECAKGGGCEHDSYDCELGADKYKVVGTYTYTFPAQEVATQADLEAALATGGDVKLAAGTYTFPASKLSEGQTLICEEGTVFEGTSGLNINGATVVGATFKNEGGKAASGTINGTFKDCTFEGEEALRWCYSEKGKTAVFENCVIKTDFRGVHFDGMDGDVVFKNCEINGFNAFGGEGTVTFEGCTFGSDESRYNGLNMYCDLVLKDCKFEYTSGKTNFIDFEAAGKTLTIENCTATLDGAAVDVLDYVGGTNKNDTTITVK